MKVSVIYVTLSLLMLLSTVSMGQQVDKHPRVIEVEEKLMREASAFLQRRLPGIAFTVSIKVDPMRRTTGYTYSSEEELPYFEIDGEEIRDEWDNPDLSVYQLIRRIKYARIEVVVPDSVDKNEMNEIKNILLLSIGLVPIRDEVKFVQKEWNSAGSDSRKLISKELYVYGGMLFVFLLAIFAILKLTLPEAGSKAEPIRAAASKPSPQIGIPGGMNSNLGNYREQGVNQGSMKADLKFRDPIKLKEVAQIKIHELIKDDQFPNLRDMIDMCKVAKTSPVSLGALIYEFSVEHQRLLFSKGKGKTWYEVFTSHGDLDDVSLQLLDKMLRMRKEHKDKNWSELLVQIWRLGDDAEEFFTELDMKQSMAILSQMPKMIAIPIARKVYPGSWGGLISHDNGDYRIKEEQVLNILARAISLKPPLDIDSLKEYSKEIDLLDYLKNAPVEEERDIYVTLPKDSYMFDFRPPFYQLFEATKSAQEELIKEYSLQEWALMLFNTPREMRSSIEMHFDEKSRYLLSNYMKSINSNGVDTEMQSLLREQAAVKCKHLQETVLDIVDDEQITFGSNEDGSDEKIAA